MKQKLLLFLVALTGLLGNCVRVWAQDIPEPTAQWSFNNADDLMAPDKGSLTLTPAVLGSKSITLSTLSNAGITQTDGPADDNKAILVPATSALKVERAEGSGASQSYTLMMDIKVHNAGPYNGLFQTDEANSNDGDLFTNSNKIGVASIGGYFGSIKNDTWYRVVLSYRDGKNILYVNGVKLVSANPDNSDRFKIQPFGFYLFCDEDGEKQDNYVSKVAFWETPLTDEQVIDLGGIVPPVVTEIATAEDLVNFAKSVNGGNNDTYAVLTADIALTSPWETPIGIDGTPFAGVFDGQGHKISGFNGTGAGKYGLFGFTSSAVVRNFSVDGTLTVTGGTGSGVVGWTTGSTISNVHSTLAIAVTEAGTHHVGGVVGSAQGSNTISRCTFGGSLTIVSGNNDNFAGVVAYLGGDRVEYCANYGTITYADLNCCAGGISAYLNNTGSSVQSCLNTGKVACEDTEGTPAYGSAIIGWLRTHDAAKLTDNCWLEGSAYGAGRNGSDVLTAFCFTEDKLPTGAVCYALNGKQTEIGWYQALGTDDAPVLDPSHGQVYMVGRLHCNGDAYENASYTNVYTEITQDDHNIVDGFCDYCNLFFEDGMTPNADGFYEIANAKQLAWFEQKVNKGVLGANAILTADIDFADLMPEGAVPDETEISWVPIGDWGNARGTGSAAYKGHFDGQGHTIKNLNATAKQNFFGLFGVISTGANIENFTIYGRYITAYQYLGGVAAYARDDELAIRSVHSYVDIINTCVGGRQGGIIGGAHGTLTYVEGCTYSGNMDSNDNGGGGNYGGIMGYANNSTATVIYISNCLFDGKLANTASAPGNCTFGGIVGYANSPYATIKNCLSIGTVESPKYAQFFGALNGPNSKILNSYYQGDYINGSSSGKTANPQEATLVTDDQLASGEITWKLNEAMFIDPIWRQTFDEDLYPVPNGNGRVVYQTQDGDYENIDPNDPESVAYFIKSVIDNETEFIEQTVAYQELLDEYAAEVQSWEDIEDLEEFIETYKASYELKERIKVSEANYVAYVQACTEAANYLTENNLEGEWSDFLQTYLQNEVEPGKDYPNGSYAYIMENRNLDDEGIAAEISFVSQMLENAIAGGITSGTEITRLLVNPNFEDGYEGWALEYEGGTATVGGNIDIMPIPEAYDNKSFNASQTLTELPNGIYMMAVNGLFRAGTDVTSQFYAGQLYMNNTYNYFMSPGEDVVSEGDAEPGVNCLGENSEDAWYVGPEEGWVPNTRNGCSVAFNAGRYQNFCATEVTDGTLTIGMRNQGTGLAKDWMPFAGVHVFYLGTASEADKNLTEVLNGYKARAEIILNFEFSEDANEFAQYPNMSEALKTQLEEAIAQIGQTEDKIALIGTFSGLFNQVLACRKAYIAMLDATNKLFDLLNDMYGKGIVSDEVYEEWENEINAARSHYTTGDVTAEEALAIADKLKNANLIDLPMVDGVYQLASARDLICFAGIVNYGMNTSDAVLVNDIDMTDYEWIDPIGFWGTNQIAYMGHFDGQGHSITNINATAGQNFFGLFGVISTGCLIENFSISGTFSTVYQYAGGVAAYSRDDELAIRNVHSFVDIENTCVGGRQGGILGGAHGTMAIIEGCTYSGILAADDNGGGGNYGGIVGYCNNSTSVYVNINNCLFDGKLVNTADSPGNCTFGGIVGYANSPFVTIKDCLSIGTVESPRNGQFFGAINGGNSRIYNSYYQGQNINGSGSGRTPTPQEVTLVTDKQLASGEICYKLNGDQSEINWYQTLFTDDTHTPDAYPVLNSTHEIVLFSDALGYYNANDPDGIKGVNAQSPMVNDQSIYNLAGQRLSKMQKGINIINSKKIVLK